MASNVARTQTGEMPLRQASTMSTNSDDAVPMGDPSDTTSLLLERLQAWKHAVGYLEDYVSAVEKTERAHGKEFEKVLKTISSPLREGHHFDQSLGGIAGLFENMRANTQGLANSHFETEKNLKGSVSPILDRLHKEIKNKSKELTSGAAKAAKEVDKARNTTQKHIELLGQHTGAFDSSGGKVGPSEDPYILQRGVFHRLNKQVLEENTSRQDLISVQHNFSEFESHIIQVIQQAMGSFNQFVGGQAAKDQNLYADMLGTAQCIPLNFEWQGFVGRNSNLLVDPNAGPRTVDSISFPNQSHSATKAMIEGTLERKSRNKLSMGGYSTGYYVVTPSKYLHEFKDNDNMRKDPVPELTIYLPDATIGATNGNKFNIKGKDVSKGIGSKLSGTSELSFKAHTAQDAETWFTVIRQAAGNTPTEPFTDSGPASPADSKAPSRSVSGATAPPQYAYQGSSSAGQPAPLETKGITDKETVTSPTASTPATSTPATAAPVGSKAATTSAVPATAPVVKEE